jgi:hypothetical protein
MIGLSGGASRLRSLGGRQLPSFIESVVRTIDFSKLSSFRLFPVKDKAILTLKGRYSTTNLGLDII